MKTTCPRIVLMLVLIQFKTTKGFFHQIIYHGFYSFLFVCSGLYFCSLLYLLNPLTVVILSNYEIFHINGISSCNDVFLAVSKIRGCCMITSYMTASLYSWGLPYVMASSLPTCGMRSIPGAVAHILKVSTSMLGASFERSECSRRRLEHFFNILLLQY